MPIASSIAAAITANPGNAALADALDAERVKRAWRVLGHQHLHSGSFPHGRQQIIRQGDAERLAALVVAKFLVKRAAETLHETADQLTLDQHRVDRPADIVGEQKALDRRLPSLGINADDADLHAVGVGHMVRAEPAFVGQPGIAITERRRVRREMTGDIRQAD
jgi:hypothetical protein